MAITASQVKELRERTSAGMLDCKKALLETDGNFEKAIEWLRAKGIAKAGNKAGRIAAEGLVHSYIHPGSRVGVLLEVNSETDFVARNEGFQSFVSDVALHVAAMAPRYVTSEEIPSEVRDAERQVLIAKAKEEGKKADMVDRIVEGQLKKWAGEICLLDQKYVKNPDVTIDTLLKETISTIGENIVIRRFVRFELGEGIEKKTEDFAAEVAKTIGG